MPPLRFFNHAGAGRRRTRRRGRLRLPPLAAALALLVCLLPAACGRPLTPTETAYARALFDGSLEVERVRLARGAPLQAVTMRIPRRPRLTCRERIFPPPRSEIVSGPPAAVTLFNTIWFHRDYWRADYLPAFPRIMPLYEAMLLAHELVHVWQWQNRAVTGYHPLKALREHGTLRDPYLFDPGTVMSFLDLGYEQQAAVVEEYVCCDTLAPDAARTRRLRAMLGTAFPVGRLPARAAILPWAGARIEGICS